MSNVIKAIFTFGRNMETKAIYQHDYGMIVKPIGINLPDVYEVHFSNYEFADRSKSQLGNEDGVSIPDEYLKTGKDVWAFIYLHTGEDDGETEYKIHIPIIPRPEPLDEPPTPQEQSVITETIAALNIAVEKSEEAVEHYPKIENGTWWVWDVNTEEFVDTGVEAQGEYAEVDSALSDTSENPVQNKVINSALSDLTDDLNHKVSDVKINGTSIVDANNEADIPFGDASSAGVVIVGNGLSMGSSGRLNTRKAESTSIKSGDANYTPIVPSNQHEATFYGLAKAANDSTQSASSNPVGTYTDDAKKAIRKMLGIPNQEWEMIVDYTVPSDSEVVEISVDSNGQPFALSKMSTRVWLTANTTGNNDFFYTNMLAKKTNNTSVTISAPIVRYPSGGVAGFCESYHELIAGYVRSEMRNGVTTLSLLANVQSLSSEISDVGSITGFKLTQYSSSSTPVKAGTRIVIYGIRID